MGRIGIDFKSLWAVFSSTPAPEYGTLPPRLESDKIPGVFIDCKKNWVQVGSKNGLCVYIARQKITRQVDLSGFGKGWVGTEPLRAKNGRVEAHLDLASLQALDHLHMLLLAMVSLPDPDKAKRAPHVIDPSKPKRVKVEKVDAASSPMSKLDAVASSERIARVWEVCKRRGVLPSEATIAEALAKGASLPDDLVKALADASPQPAVIEEPVLGPVFENIGGDDLTINELLPSNE